MQNASSRAPPPLRVGCRGRGAGIDLGGRLRLARCSPRAAIFVTPRPSRVAVFAGGFGPLTEFMGGYLPARYITRMASCILVCPPLLGLGALYVFLTEVQGRDQATPGLRLHRGARRDGPKVFLSIGSACVAPPLRICRPAPPLRP